VSKKSKRRRRKYSMKLSHSSTGLLIVACTSESNVKIFTFGINIRKTFKKRS
jgi:hypothetical protein